MDEGKFYRVTYATITLIIKSNATKMISSYHCYFYSSLRSSKSKSSLRTLYVRISTCLWHQKSHYNLLYYNWQLRSRRTPISFSYRLASWYVLAYFVRKIYFPQCPDSTLSIRSGCQPITHFIRSWDNCAYFARNDFYESKILKILTLPRSLD